LNSRSEEKVASDPESIRARALKSTPGDRCQIWRFPATLDFGVRGPDNGVFGLDLGLGEGFEGDGEECNGACCDWRTQVQPESQSLT